MKGLPEDPLDQVQCKKHCTGRESVLLKGKALGVGIEKPVCCGFEFL